MMIVNFGHKHRREEFYFKNKFHTDEVKGDQLDKLKVFCVQAMGKPFADKMFSSDFKLHCECIESYSLLMQE
jgi:hypothetical protein